MMKTVPFTLTFAIMALSTLVKAQSYSGIVPLQYNSYIETEHHNSTKSFTTPANFVYLEDTLQLPIFDDFTIDKFFKQTALKDSDGVISEKTFKLVNLQTGEAIASNLFWVDEPSLKITYKLVDGNETEDTQEYLPSLSVLENDFTAYPIRSVQRQVYPAYTVYERPWLAVTDPSYIDTLFLEPDYSQDSIVYYIVPSGWDESSIWIDHQAFFNRRMSWNAPSLGVATLDGNDEQGFPYDINDKSAYGIADMMTSKPLFFTKNDDKGRALAVSDSIYLSFSYQPGGLGNFPDPEDSLLVDYYDPLTNEWETIWRTPGIEINRHGENIPFQNVVIPLNNDRQLADGSRFRFKNYATLSGQFDLWHLDYIHLATDRTFNDTIIQDIAIGDTAISFLKEQFTAIPWEHYKNKDEFTVDNLTIKLNNNSSSPRIVNEQNGTGYIVKYKNQVLAQKNSDVGFLIQKQSFVNASIPFSLDFNQIVNTEKAPTFDITLFGITNNTGELSHENDTVHLKQEFSNYYAYDDGTAEAIYPVFSKEDHGRIAVKYHLEEGDSLYSLYIRFEPVNNGVIDPSLVNFYLTVWDDANGVPNNVIYENETLHRPVFKYGRGNLYRYDFDEPIYVSGDYYVGVTQIDPERINIGYDLNTSVESSFYHNDIKWVQTPEKGAMMIRPVFGNKGNVVTAVNEEDFLASVKIYPNPVKSEFKFEGVKADKIKIHSIIGAEIVQIPIKNKNKVNIDFLSKGVYFIEFMNEDLVVGTTKLVKE